MPITSYLATSDSQLGNIGLAGSGSQTFDDTVTLSTVNSAAFVGEIPGVVYNDSIIISSTNHFTLLPGTAFSSSITLSSVNNVLVLSPSVWHTYNDSVTFSSVNAVATEGIRSNEVFITLSSTNSFVTDGTIPPIKWGDLTLSTTNSFTLGVIQTVFVSVSFATTHRPAFVAGGTVNVVVAFTTQNTFGLVGQKLNVISITQSLVFSQVAKRVKEVSAFNSLTIAQAAVKVRIIPLSVSSTLGLTDLASYNTTFHRAAANTIVFQAGYNQYISMGGTFGGSGGYVADSGNTPVATDHYVFVPTAVVRVVPRKSSVVLSVPGLAIVLTSPLMGDTFNYSGGDLTIKYSVIGNLYTFLRQTDLCKFRYTFELDRVKSLELRAFILNAYAKIIDLENWKGEHWKVYITNGPVPLTPKYRGGNTSQTGERVQVEMEFEGYKIAG